MNTCTREHLCTSDCLEHHEVEVSNEERGFSRTGDQLGLNQGMELGCCHSTQLKKNHMYYIQGLVCSLTSQSYTWTYKWIIVENFFTTCIHSAACLSDDRRGGFTSRSGWLAYCMSKQSPRRAISFHPPSDSTSHTDRLSSRAIISSIN